MKFQLIAKITDQELLQKSIHELGTVFYVTDEKHNIIKVVYFSGSSLVISPLKRKSNLASFFSGSLQPGAALKPSDVIVIRNSSRVFFSPHLTCTQAGEDLSPNSEASWIILSYAGSKED